jgi:hypothetical protein
MMGKPQCKKPLGRPRHSWVYNIYMDFGEIRWGYEDWTDLARGRGQWKPLVNMVMNLQVP